MKTYIKSIITIIALLCSVNTWAQGTGGSVAEGSDANGKFTFIYQLDGATSTEAAAGKIIASMEETNDGMVYTLKARIKEIRSGEEDDLDNY